MNTVMLTTATLQDYTATQHFNRTKMSLLWNNKSDVIDKGQKALLKVLYDNKNRGTLEGKVTIKYHLTTTKPGELGYGRYYGQKGSLEAIDKDVRGTLCSEYYTDIDIVNCHPVLMVQLGKLFDIEMTGYEYYNNHRDTFIAEICKQFNCFASIVKDVPIRIAYGGAVKYDNEETVDNIQNINTIALWDTMKKDIDKLYKKLIESGLHNELHDYCVKQKRNVKGTFLSYILQTYERKCLEAMVEYFNKNNYTVDVLCYDGCMVRSTDVSDEVLEGAEKAVKNATGFDIKLKIKPLIGISDDELNTGKTDDDDGYSEMKEEWEKDHFYFDPTNTIVKVKNGSMFHYGIEHATEAFNMWLLKGKKEGEDQLFLKKWRTDPNRKIVDTLVYKMPEDCLKNEASLFTGFAYKRITNDVTDQQRKDAVNTFNDILSAICNDEEEVTDYVRKGFAHMLKKPFERTGVIVAFASKIQGSGKDTIMTIIKRVIGDGHTAHYTSTESYWEKHDTRQEGAIFVYLEEACSALNKSKANELKARITSNSITINPKGVKGYNVPNIGRQYMTTNEIEPFKIEEHDRRGMLISPNGRCVSYDWTEIYSKIYTPEYVKAVGEYLESIDIDGWNPRKFPETEIKKEMKELGRSSESEFFSSAEWNESREWYSSADLYDMYRAFCGREGLPYAMNVVSFSKKIAFITDKNYKKREGRGRSREYAHPETA